MSIKPSKWTKRKTLKVLSIVTISSLLAACLPSGVGQTPIMPTTPRPDQTPVFNPYDGPILIAKGELPLSPDLVAESGEALQALGHPVFDRLGEFLIIASQNGSSLPVANRAINTNIPILSTDKIVGGEFNLQPRQFSQSFALNGVEFDASGKPIYLIDPPPWAHDNGYDAVVRIGNLADSRFNNPLVRGLFIAKELLHGPLLEDESRRFGREWVPSWGYQPYKWTDNQYTSLENMDDSTLILFGATIRHALLSSRNVPDELKVPLRQTGDLDPLVFIAPAYQELVKAGRLDPTIPGLGNFSTAGEILAQSFPELMKNFSENTNVWAIAGNINSPPALGFDTSDQVRRFMSEVASQVGVDKRPNSFFV